MCSAKLVGAFGLGVCKYFLTGCLFEYVFVCVCMYVCARVRRHSSTLAGTRRYSYTHTRVGRVSRSHVRKVSGKALEPYKQICVLAPLASNEAIKNLLQNSLPRQFKTTCYSSLKKVLLVTNMLQSGTCFAQLCGIWNLELGTWSLELGARSLELGTWSLQLGT